jgi:hypothetical protein
MLDASALGDWVLYYDSVIVVTRQNGVRFGRKYWEG